MRKQKTNGRNEHDYINISLGFPNCHTGKGENLRQIDHIL
jgi:hypothetical protein